MKPAKTIISTFIIFTLLSVLIPSISYSGFVSPSRIYINDGRMSAAVSITNRSDEALVYNFEWERRARTPDGAGTYLVQEGETYGAYKPADPYLLYSPRRVVVEPGETQRVRLLARRPGGMPAGEYRSHLRITSDRVNALEKAQAGSSQLSGVLELRPALSIPVMLRTGKTVVDIAVTGAKIVQEGLSQVAHLDITNSSTRSIYGVSFFKCVLAGSGEVKRIRSNGFRLYYETLTLKERFVVPDEIDPNQCTSLDIELTAGRDPDYRGVVIGAAKLK